MLPEEQKTVKAEYEQLQDQSGKAKKKLIIILCVILAVIALMVSVIAILEKRAREKSPEEPIYNYTFYPPYEGDILQNGDYLGLDRELDYCSDPSGLGVTVSLHEGNRSDFDATVLFFQNYLDTLIRGDATAYNGLFHESYFLEYERKASFYPQMVYDPLLVYVNEEKDGDDRLVTYRLTYKIYRNDGSFRRDIDSDASRPQNITLRVTPAGDISIINIVTFHKKQ